MLLGGGAQAYQIEQSLRFNNADSAHLHRTPSSAGSQTTFTLSVWVKSSVPSSGSEYFYATHNGSRWNGILRRSGNYDFGVDESGGSAPKVVTNAKLRDPSAWYHLVMAYDTTQATSTDRVKIWINGELQSINTGAGSYPSQNHGSTFNRAVKHWIGALDDTNSVYYTQDFYLAEYHLLDGTAVTNAEDFGEYDQSGVWRPIEYTGGNYGTTGFYLKFDPTATNGIGHDHSGNGNNWTASGFTTNPSSYSLAYVSSGSFDYNELLINAIDKTTNTNAGVTTSTASSNTDVTITFDPPLNGDITIHNVDDRTSISASGAYYRLKDSNGTTLVTQAPPTGSNPDYTHSSLSDVATLEMHGGSGSYGGVSIGGVESSGDTIRTAYQLSLGDVVEDTPTKNWCTLNPVDAGSNNGLADGNLKCGTTSNANTTSIRGTYGLSSGKWYFEVHRQTAGTTNIQCGWAATTLAHKFDTGDTGVYNKSISGQTVMIAADFDNNAIWTGVDGVWDNSATVSEIEAGTTTNATHTSVANYPLAPMFLDQATSYSGEVRFTFGQHPFAYTPPTGFKALNTSNLSAPDIADGSQYFNTVLYTGNGTTNARTDVGFQPDLTWIKTRSIGSNHSWYDVIRGTNKVIGSSATDAETTDGSVTPTATGFTLGSDNTSFGSTNYSGATYVAWNWLAGGSGSSNTSGSITSTVSANASAGFSIVSFTGKTYTGNSSTDTGTVGHGLGVAPSFYVVKARNGTSDWICYHSALGNTKYVSLNTADNATTNTNMWASTSPTDTVFTMGPFWPSNIADGKTMIAYCFAEVEGYSKAGVIKGTYTTDGPFVHLGFTPALLMFKNAERSGTDWAMIDATRDPYNYAGRALRPNSSAIEDTYTERLDIVSNGFKLRTSDFNYNGPDDNPGILYMAFASNPFGGDGVSPATAR